ncbi:MAG TPA: hypothetical protein VJ888_08225 [Mobilitalea sp.]|nr:hypothetical protein [Mobilitalea sp.]
MQNLFSQNIIIYILAGLCGLGLITRLILDLVYIYLVHESDNLGATKNKLLKHIKMKFETCYKLKIGVNNVDTFVDKNVLRYRFCGVLLSTWESFSGQLLLISFLIVPISTVFGVMFECGQDLILRTGAVGILTGSILILVDKIINLATKKQVIRLNLMDYLENFCKVRLEQEAFRPELLEQYRREYFHVVESKKQTSATIVQTKEDPKNELNRRREARQRKEEERKALALKREAEQKKIELARKEEEQKKLEERRKAAARRREEELLKLKEEKEALEIRRAELKKKAEGKQQQNDLKQQAAKEEHKALHSLEELAEASKPQEIDLMQGMDESAACKEKTDKNVIENTTIENKPIHKEPDSKGKGTNISPQEEKLIEDILKEYFA